MIGFSFTNLGRLIQVVFSKCFWRGKEIAENRTNEMCGECVYPIKDCPWMSKGQPVPGWDAEDDEVKVSDRVLKTYYIKNCPLFVPHPRSTIFDREGNRV
jgi:hypothetical protein